MDQNEARQVIFDFLRLEHKLENADAIFVVGGSTPDPALMASKIYSDGWAPKLAFIDKGGTFGPADGTPTAELYKTVFFMHGFPKEDILYDALTGNTLEEARKAVPFLIERGVNPRTVILVARAVHQRRAWATFQRQWPRIKFVSYPADEDVECEETSRLLAELDRLELYGSRGDLLPQEIPAEVQTARVFLKNM